MNPGKRVSSINRTWTICPAFLNAIAADSPPIPAPMTSTVSGPAGGTDAVAGTPAGNCVSVGTVALGGVILLGVFTWSLLGRCLGFALTLSCLVQFFEMLGSLSIPGSYEACLLNFSLPLWRKRKEKGKEGCSRGRHD